ncbi:hypothetical protein G7046_g5452 [Stylonectria norvegica]|nr:hypothetical protein G7046_g5452 [Stylonectria norvegica]
MADRDHGHVSFPAKILLGALLAIYNLTNFILFIVSAIAARHIRWYQRSYFLRQFVLDDYMYKFWSTRINGWEYRIKVADDEVWHFHDEQHWIVWVLTSLAAFIAFVTTSVLWYHVIIRSRKLGSWLPAYVLRGVFLTILIFFAVLVKRYDQVPTGNNHSRVITTTNVFIVLNLFLGTLLALLAAALGFPQGPPPHPHHHRPHHRPEPSSPGSEENKPSTRAPSTA